MRTVSATVVLLILSVSCDDAMEIGEFVEENQNAEGSGNQERESDTDSLGADKEVSNDTGFKPNADAQTESSTDPLTVKDTEPQEDTVPEETSSEEHIGGGDTHNGFAEADIEEEGLEAEEVDSQSDESTASESDSETDALEQDENETSGTTKKSYADIGNCTSDHYPQNEADWIANFETGTVQAGNGVEEYVGFYSVQDETTGAEMVPPLWDDVIGDATTDELACSSAVMCAKNIQGRFDIWGTAVAMDWAEDEDNINELTQMNVKVPRDLSGYKGIAFYAMRRSGVSTLRVGFPDKNTHPDGNVCDDSDTNSCYNDWSEVILLVEENVWERVEILFDDIFINPDWGAQPSAFDIENSFGMYFLVAEMVDFDFCIDDIYLIPAD